MTNEYNKIPKTCIIFALNHFFSEHEDMKTWEELENGEILGSLWQPFEDYDSDFIYEQVEDLARQLMDFTLEKGGEFSHE
jgi:hypothetical protein